MDEVLREAIAAVREIVRLDVEELAAGRREEVRVWRQPFGGRPHDPQPWASERAGEDPVWRTRSADEDGEWVGLDAHGRPVLSELRRGMLGELVLAETLEVWCHAENVIDVYALHEGGRRVVLDGDCAIAVVSHDERVLTVERWTWAGDVPVRGEIASLGPEWGAAEVYVARVGDDGRLELLSRGYHPEARGEEEEERSLDRLLAQAATLTADDVVYDARANRYEPRLSPNQELLSVLPGALERAAVAGVAAAGVARPFVVEVHPGPFAAFRPFGRVAGERFRDRMVAVSPEPDAAIESLARAEPPDGARFELLDWLDDHAARLCRELTAATEPTSDLSEDEQQRASAVLERVGRELAARLNQRSWPDPAEPFLALVHVGATYGHLDPYALAAEAVGTDRVARFRASIQRAAKPATPAAPARHDRAALAWLLAERGLAPHAHRLAYDVAKPAFRLRAADQAASRLGGPGLLPPGASWPRGDGDRPLTFLAGISLAELPEPGPLPPAGWLLFFADIDIGEGDGLVDEASNEPGASARLLAVPTGTEPVQATPPEALHYVLSERRVRFEPQLTLPDAWDAGRHLGLDPAEEDAYTAVAEWLRYGEQGPSHEDPDHWVLGAVTGVQAIWPDPDTMLLLHLSWDEALGLEYADGGTIQFRIPPQARAVGDWGASRIGAVSN